MTARRFERWRVGLNFEEDEDRCLEPGYRRMVELAGPFLGRENNEIVHLNVAKMADYAERGVDGIINVICFNCLLGTVSAALTGALRKRREGIPLTTLVYSGSDTLADRARLEAFVHQVMRYAAGRRPVGGPPVRPVPVEEAPAVPEGRVVAQFPAGKPRSLRFSK